MTTTYDMPRYADQAGGVITVLKDGARAVVPVDPANADCAALLGSGVEVAPFRSWNDLTEAKATLTATVKAEAGRRILAIMPEWKQRNATAHGLAMVRKIQQGGNLTPAEEAAESAYAAAWAMISQIRAASDAKEAEIDALTDLETAEVYALDAGWPA